MFKGCTQLRLLCQDDVASLLSKSLPPDWSGGETVFWYHGLGSHNHPATDWLELLWSYLRKNFATIEELRRFEGLPLIPLDMSEFPISLVRLRLPSKIVVRSLHDDSVHETLTQTLKKLGVIIIEECPGFLSLHPAVINKCIHPPSSHGVLKALVACSSTIPTGIHSVTDEGKRSLRNVVSKVSSLEPQAKQLLCSLPLFETLTRSFVSKTEGFCAAPDGSFPVASRIDLIDVTHDDSKKLAHLLDIRILSSMDFLLEIVFPDVEEGHYSNEEIDRIMAFVMERYHVFAGGDARFKKAMKSLPFVSTNNGRARAMDLFDPRKDMLKAMLADEDVFPVGAQYTNPAVLVVLDKLGMKSEKEINGQDLYQSAKMISVMSNISAAKQKSETIMSYLHSNPMKLQDNVFGVALAVLLQDIPWISAMRQRPHGFEGIVHLWGETRQTVFFKPTEVTSEDKINLIGTVKPMVKIDSSSHLAKCFGWDKMPIALGVVKHLKSVISHYTQDEKPYYIAIVKDIYSFLSHSVDPDAIKEALKGIENSRWIWNGDGFSSPDVILAERPSIDLTPYICSLPSEVLEFSSFFSKFGMREHCDDLFLLQVLHIIKRKYESECNHPNSDVKKDLQLSVDILNEIKPNVGEQLSPELQKNVLIPTHVVGDAFLNLAPVEDCMYCEHEWLERGNHGEDMDFLYVHPNIPNSTAELLQVRTLTNRMLEPEEMQIGDEFGQEEKLTRRLNRLLEEYTDGFAVPKELIQNADDAGATEVRFLYDERTNEDAMTCLIDDGMKECQGPALWVYNDAEFRDDDFQNITKLNGGTKEQETEKIGKFGLGFNAVYNLTDVPMFLSRNYFVIFDPNTFYLGKAIRNKSKPGMKIDTNKNPKRLQKFRNQFKPFNGIFGCELYLDKEDNSFQGTLFRFPLRTKEQAVRSEIKQVYYDSKQIRDLLQIFVRGARTLLHFTQNVRQVSIFHLPKESTDQTQPKLIFEVTKSLSKAGIIRELSVSVTLPPQLHNISTDDQYLLKQCNFLRASSEVAKHIGDDKETRYDLLRSAFTINIKGNVTECGRSFFEDKGSLQNASEVWLIVSSMGKGQAMQLSVNDRSLLPSAGVAVQLIPKECGTLVPQPVVDQTAGHESHHHGTVFCYLPLPIHSGLPVHVNGAFAVASSRRQLKQKTEDDKACYGEEWNDVLLKDSVCAAYLDLLEDVKSAATMYSFHSLWPRACHIEPCCEPLAHSFYQQVASGGYSLFSDGNKWVDINQVVFLEPNFRQDQQVGDIAFEIFKILVKGDEAVIDLPTDVLQSFKKYDLAEKIQGKTYDNGRFLRELFFPNIASVPPDLRDKLVLYALDDAKGEFDELINTYACIPASPSGQTLKCPAQLVNPNKATASLFSNEDERFPFGTDTTFLDSLRLAKLEQLGMVADDPPWIMLEERAKSISVLNENDSKAASKRAKALIDILEKKLKSENESTVPEDVHDNLLQVKFLPVASKPETFPLFWKGDDLQVEKRGALLSPSEAFKESKKYLVCCSEPLVDLFIPFTVEAFLQLDKKQVTLRHIETQLKVASSTSDSLDFTQFDEVKTVCFAAYRYLRTALQESKIEEEEIREMFQERKFILAGREFVDTKHVAFELAVDCSPYLHKLPDDLAKPFDSLMRSAGIKEVFEANDFIASLEQIKEKFKDAVLDKKNLQVAIHLAGQLGECLKEHYEVEERQQTIYLPDSQGIMRPASELCIEDCLWISDESDVYFANSKIPHPTCIKLGAKTRREGALNRFAVGIPFGQNEKLTNRLKRLLEAYPCEEEILKELLQNADDAEATEICFIKDTRQHPDERVFEDSWKPLQGPALCVYNNKPFTEADIKGIQSLGEGSKGDDPNKTGQYGVGFNAVYHLTDVPSFASSGEEIGDVLCVFDPLCKYVPGANAREPGRMFRETTKLRGMFPDVFSCYLEDRFPLHNSTMFRFPLRNQELADDVNQEMGDDVRISNSPVTLEGLERMMEALKSELFDVLLFVNNVKKITLFDIDQSGNLVSSYFAEAKMSDEDSGKRRQFANYVKQSLKSVNENGDVLPINVDMKKCSYVLHLKDSIGNEEKWLVVQQIGFENDVGTSIVSAYRSHDLGMLPRGGVACLFKDRSSENESSERKHKAYCFLPLPIETDLPVHINGHFALDHETRRNLWRDKSDGYQTDWNNALIKDVIASCYLTLLDEVRNFLQLPVTQSTEPVVLACGTDALVGRLDDYEKLFPRHPCSEDTSNPYWKGLVTSVYQGMDHQRKRLLPVVRDYISENSMPKVQLKWLPLTGDGKDKAFFNNLGECECFSADKQQSLDDKEEKKRIEKKTSFEQILLRTGFNLVAFSLSIYKAMTRSDVNLCCVSPSAVMEFYKSFICEDSLCRIGPIAVEVEKTPFKSVHDVTLVLKYCKGSKQFLENLSGLPLLLTQDNRLRTFSISEPTFISSHHSILPQCKQMFVHDHIRRRIFGDAKSLKASVFKHFDVESFEANLNQTLPREYFNSEGYVKWCPDQTTEPNRGWLYRTWTFLQEETENALKEAKASEEDNTKSIEATKTTDEINVKNIQTTKASGEVNTRSIKATQLPKEKEIAIIRSVLEPLNNWNILPCTKPISAVRSHDESAPGMVREHFLVPLSLTESVLDFTCHDATSYRLLDALRVLSLPELDICAVTWSLARRLVASLRSPVSLLTSLSYTVTNSLSLEGKLQRSECVTILQFFSNSVEHLQEKDMDALRRLPFYEATHGGLVSLSSKRVCLVPSEIPRRGMEVLERHSNMVFLESQESLSPLFEFLTFETVSTIDIYCNFILKDFWLFSEKARLVHLEHIRDSILRNTEEGDKQRLLNCLTNTEIVPSKDGNLKKASCYYDPENEVFTTMLTKNMFPPKPFNTEKWLSFLKSVGLIHEVSKSLFKTFAMKIAREGATQRTTSTDEKSKVLVAHLFNREDVVKEGLLRVVCDIRFVASYPVEPELRAIHPQFGENYGQTPYIAFKGSALKDDAEIIWTTAPLLPEWADPRKYKYEGHYCDCDSILAHLEVLAQPTAELVTLHCENVCRQLVKENESDICPEERSTRMSVMAKIYRFLQSGATFGTFAEDRLRHTPCILVEQGSRCVNAQQVVIELYEDLEIKPFLYGMPAELGEFKHFFRYLGCSPSVQLSHYAMVLDLLHKKCKENSLGLNDIDSSLKAMKGIFEVLRDHPDGEHCISSLYLPATCPFGSDDETTRTFELTKAAELLFDDASYYHDRIRNFDQLFVVDLKVADVRCNSSANYKELVLLLPEALQPQMLSRVVGETFVGSRENIERFDVGAASSLRKQLHSEQFYGGIVRLIRHASHEYQEKVDEGVLASLKSTLQSIEFHGMRKLVTHLLHNGSVIPGSEKEVPYFVEKVFQSGQEIWNIYVDAVEDTEETMSAVALTLSQVIKDACKGLLRDTAMYIPQMLHSQPGTICSLLDRMKIRQDDSYDAGKGDVFLPPGSFIPIAEHHLLNPDFILLKPGDYVGYELEDPSLQLEEGEATYVYAIIIEEVPNDDTILFLKSYKINIGQDKEPIVVPATDLYKLYRFQEISITDQDQKFSGQGTNEKQAIFEDISKALEEACRLSEDRRRKVIKRLFLIWRPDKNTGNEEFCTQVCQHIKKEIERLEREETYDAFLDVWETRARQFNSRRQAYRETYQRRYGTRTWEVPPSFCTTNPQPREAKRWLRQAEDDLAAAVNDINTGIPSYVWVCFKCHQVTTKKYIYIYISLQFVFLH